MAAKRLNFEFKPIVSRYCGCTEGELDCVNAYLNTTC